MIKYPQKIKQSSSIAPLKRVTEEDKDGRILSIEINRLEKILRLNHSKIGLCNFMLILDEIPIDSVVYTPIKSE